MATPVIPPPPEGFTLDSGVPPPPEGFTLDSKTPDKKSKPPESEFTKNATTNATTLATSMIEDPTGVKAGFEGLSMGLEKLEEVGGDITAFTSKPYGFKETPEQAAQREAKSRTVGEAIPDALLSVLPIGEEAKGAEVVGDAVKAAKDYVSKNTSLNWDNLAQSFKDRITSIAKDSKNLDKLNPKAVERQGLLSSLDKPIPGTKGQLTRDPLQQRREQLAKASNEGGELAQLDIEQNKAMSDNLDILKSRSQGTGKAVGDVQTGASVQGALRAAYKRAQSRVRKLYGIAEKNGELQSPVNIKPLKDYIDSHPDLPNVSYIKSRLEQIGAYKAQTGADFTVSLRELEAIRRSAVAAAKDGGTKGFYAGEVKSVIDDMTKGAGGEAYQAARTARAKVGEEYERTSAVARLVKNRKLTQDRATALEDTWQKTVKNGSLEDLQKVRGTLTKSKDGQAAWGDLKAATIDYIKEKATGGPHGLRNKAGELNITWSGIKRAVDEIGQDKLKELLGNSDAQKLNDIVDSAQILKTEAPSGVKGSPSIDKLITFLDHIPVVGDIAIGTAKLVKKAGDIGKSGRVSREAMKDPLSEESVFPLKKIAKAAPASGVFLLKDQEQPP